MTTDMKHDAIMLYQTLFSQAANEHLHKNSWISLDEQQHHDMRILFLKRLALCLATCRVSYTTENNGVRLMPWNFPLASVFCHGSRLMLRLVGVHWKELVNFLIF